MSRRHAELTPDDGAWYLRDLDSANGTFVNGERIDERVRLEAGDQVRCGSTLLVFAVTPEAARSTTIQMVSPQQMDATVEHRVDANEESMILAAPDPLKAAMDHLRVIYDLTALTASAVDWDELLEKVMDLLIEEFRPDRGFVLLRGRETDYLDPVVVRYRERPQTVDEGRIPVSRTIVQHVLQQRAGILSTNAMADRRFSSGDSIREYGIRTAICVPIRAGDRLFGVLHIDSSMANFTYTEPQLRLMTAIGQHTGLALQSAELLRDRMHRERLAAMGETIATLSHSIKNILQGLRGGADAVELALKRNDLDLAREGWPILSRNLDRIFALTMNMLAYSKPRTMELELRPLGPLIREVVGLAQPQADRKGVGVILELDETVPPVPIDSNAMHQVLMNLVVNALDAVPSKRGVVTLRATYDPGTARASITVADNGPGIPADLQDEIFEAFRSSKGQRGTGLGLAVSRKLVEEHRGTLTVRSKLGEGAEFTIELPSDLTLDSGRTRLPRARSTDPLEEEFG